MVTPQAGPSVAIVTGGTAVVAIGANVNGGYITNPLTFADQDVSSPAEPLYIDPVVAPGLVAIGTTIALQPGQTYNVVPGSSLFVRANATSNGHRFTAVQW